MFGNDRLRRPVHGRRGWQLVVLAAVYFAVARLGLSFPLPPGYVSIVWPASGVALAAVVILGPRVWPGIWAGAFLANLLVFALPPGQDGVRAWATAAVIATGNTLEAVLAHRLLRWGDRGAELADQPRQVLTFLLASVAACLVGASVGILGLLAGRWPAGAPAVALWQRWWLSDLVGIVVVTPAILAWRLPPAERRAPVRRAERAAFVVAAAVVLALTQLQHPGHAPPTLYPLMVCQIWAAVRLGLVWTTTVTLAQAATMLVLTAEGIGTFAAYTDPAAHFFLLGFSGTCAAMALVLAVIATSQRLATDALRRSGQQLQTLLDNVASVIFQKDRDGRYLAVNRRFLEFVDAGADAVLGKTDEDLFPADVAAAIRATDVLVATTGRTLTIEEVVPGRAGPRTFLSAKFPLRNAQGDLEGIFGVATDITDRLRAETQQRRILALTEADTLKNQFLNILSHELRTPLTVIMGYSAILERELAGPLNNQQHAYLGKVQQAADNMLKLVSDLLDMSRILAGRFTVQPQVLNPAVTVERAVSGLWVLARQRGVNLINDVPPDVPLVLADPQRLEQVVTNLVGNALKFTPAGGEIRLTAGTDGKCLRLAVRDTGEGIPVARQPLLFHRFSQVDMSLERRASGLGLGLSICREIVQAHGGEIGVDSAPGRGSTFWFTLPLADSHPLPERPAA